LTLDAGALIAVDRGEREMMLLVAFLKKWEAPVTVPATALAQAVRRPARQARVSRLLNQPETRIVVLDRADATAVGQLLAATQTSDIAVAHVVLCARRSGQAVATSDPDDLRRLDPGIRFVEI
jgi:hypothetical protein